MLLRRRLFASGERADQLFLQSWRLASIGRGSTGLSSSDRDSVVTAIRCASSVGRANRSARTQGESRRPKRFGPGPFGGFDDPGGGPGRRRGRRRQRDRQEISSQPDRARDAGGPEFRHSGQTSRSGRCHWGRQRVWHGNRRLGHQSCDGTIYGPYGKRPARDAPVRVGPVEPLWMASCPTDRAAVVSPGHTFVESPYQTKSTTSIHHVWAMRVADKC